jgi:putative ABC transport system permease protein
VSSLWQDVLYGLRMLIKKPGFTAIASLSLALGIGANGLIFSILNATLLRPLPYPDARRLVIVWNVPETRTEQRNGANGSSYFAWRDGNHSFEAIGAMNGASRNLGADGGGRPAERIEVQTFSPSMFKVLGVQPLLGRAFLDSESQLGEAAPVVLLSDGFWEKHFHRDPNVVGKTLTLDGGKVTIVGVMPPKFNFFFDDAELWAPLEIGRVQAQSKQGFLPVIARLKPGVSMAQAEADVKTISARIALSDPERNKGMTARVEPLQDAAFGGLRNPLLILQGAVAFVLLIGCANVAGLLLARAASRRTEIAIRTAIGAGRSRIVRQLVTESLPLALLGGIIGFGLAWAGLKLFVALAPTGFPRLIELTLDASALGFTALISLVTGVAFSIVPALQVSKTGLGSALKETGRSGTEGAARQYARSVLVVVQISLALVLLVGAGLMINSFARAQNSPLGADPKGLLTFEFRFTQNETITPYGRFRGVGLWDVNPATTQTYDRVLERMKAVPGVTAAAGISRPPLNGNGISMTFGTEGRPAPPPSPSGANQEQVQAANYFAVTPGYFSTMKIPVLRGREFTALDKSGGANVIIINQTMARRFWPNEEPLGRHITLDFVPDEPPREIVGIVADTPANRLQKRQAPIMYVPHGQQPPRWLGPAWNDRAAMFFVLRTAGDPMSLVPAVRRAVSEIDPNHPAAGFRTVETYLDQQVQDVRTYMALLAIFGAIAAVLSAIGIYGVMAYSVAERTREIGIRMALGAGSQAVLGVVMRKALILVTLGLAIGLAASFALTRLIASALFGVTATDPPTFAAVSILLAMVALAACVVPTRRAVTVDPTVALRYD